MFLKTHRPFHIFLDDTIYFITANTYHRNLINTDLKKRSVQAKLFQSISKYHLNLYAWVILNNHYHILVKIFNRLDLSRFVQKLHSDIALALNSIDHAKGRRVIYQYWDKCVDSERGFWTRFNYIHHNCIKHGLAKKIEDYPFSSYHYYLEKYGQEWLNSCFELYPIMDFSNPNDGGGAKLTLR